MSRPAKEALASLLLPSYSTRLDKANYLALVRAWVRENRPQISLVDSRPLLYAHLNEELVRGAPIDYFEFGVYQGNSLREWVRMNPNPSSRFWGFDSFRGLPEDWVPGFAKGSYDLAGSPPVIPDPRVTLVEGEFQTSLPTFLLGFHPASRLVVHLDCDLYSSALFCLASCDSLFVPGTIIVFDEFCVPLHEFRAFRDYSSAFRRRLKPVAMVGERGQQVAFLVE
ncbi:MAG: class I SAM-dependent methyltransferase [Thermoplasmata archaeon]|nr:class I SAM-dependent methyltransferase [Thermoplasmata archaeon]